MNSDAKNFADVLVVDDDRDHLKLCRDILKEHNYTCLTATDPAEALAIVKSHTLLVAVVDLKMPKMNGVDVLQQVRRLAPNLPVIMLTAYPTTSMTVEAIKTGAFDFLEKPISADSFMVRVEKAIDYRNVFHDLRSEGGGKKRAATDQMGYLNLVGRSKAMQKVYETIDKIAAHDINVFIYGETGTGKELTAEAIFRSSKRVSAPFIPIDCTALSGSLIESELFGYEKGAFTGADSAKEGLLESAHGGTVFLDEITEIHPELQARFLRVLERGHIRRVGGRDLINLDIRFISATNRNPWDAIRGNRLREDLFHRLNGITVNLPALTEREGDIELLSNYFLRKISASSRGPIKKVDGSAIKKLRDYHWPGNVRELSKLMEQLHILTNDEVISEDDLPPYITGSDQSDVMEMNYGGQYKGFERKWLRECRRTYFNNLLNKHDHNISDVAREAGVDRTSIYRWMKKSGANPIGRDRRHLF